MQKAFDEMDRRRDIQIEYNEIHQIIPKSIKKSVQESLINCEKLATVPLELEEEPLLRKDFPRLIEKLEKEMYSAARNLEFEKAAELRDRIKKIREKDLMITAWLRPSFCSQATFKSRLKKNHLMYSWDIKRLDYRNVFEEGQFSFSKVFSLGG